MGMGELFLILFIVVLFFGTSRLPAIGQGLGKALRSVKGAMGTDERPPRGGTPRREPPRPPEDGPGA